MKLTKKPLDRFFMVRLKESDFRLLHAAAARHEVSMSDIARVALRAKVKALLRCAEQASELSRDSH